MSKLIVFLLIAAAIYLVLRARGKPRRDPHTGVRAPEDMVTCAHCGMILPKSEALESQGSFFCSEDHRRGLPG